MSYNLTDNVNESFQFSINNINYTMRYPIVEEMDTLRDIAKTNEEKDKKGELVDRKNEEDYMYSFISPVEKDSPSIQDILKTQNIKVLQNFNTMFKTEFGIE